MENPLSRFPELLKKLQQFVQKITDVPATEWIYFLSQLRLSIVGKNEYLFQEGEPVKSIYFLAKGLAYQFYLTPFGEEKVKAILPEGNLVTAYRALLKGGSSEFNCKSLEKCYLIELSYESLQKLYARHACWERLGRLSAESLFIRKEEREYDFLTKGARLRYEDFLKEHGSLVDRVPQYLIASYLGLNPVSLSRLKSSLSSKASVQ